MTVTTSAGVPSVATAIADAVDGVRPGTAGPRALRRHRGARLTLSLVLADTVAAAIVGVAGAAAVAPAWSGLTTEALTLVWPVVVAVAGGYTLATGRADVVRPQSLLRAAALTAVLALAVVAVAPATVRGGTVDAARSTLAVVSALGLLSLVTRLVAARVSPASARRVVLAGDPAGVRTLLAEARRAAASGRPAVEPVAVCLHGDPDGRGPADDGGTLDGLPAWAGTDDLLEALRTSGADAVVAVPGPGVGHAELRRWGAWLQDSGADLLVSSGLRDVAPRRLEITTLGGVRLLNVRPAAITGVAYVAKGVCDRAAAALLLLACAPLLLVLAVLIRRDSPGPALYTQTRVGRHGRPFTVYKLRTMRADADAVVTELAASNESDREGVLFKIRRDPRTTRLGARLRTWSLDELPQLLNVVRGEMSLIGPRPALPQEVRAYATDVQRRLAVKPGLTGLWQVSGRSDLSWEETVRLDLAYVDNWSWALDARIALRTFGAVARHRGAY